MLERGKKEGFRLTIGESKKDVGHYESGRLLPNGTHESICQILMQAELD